MFIIGKYLNVASTAEIVELNGAFYSTFLSLGISMWQVMLRSIVMFNLFYFIDIIKRHINKRRFFIHVLLDMDR